MKKIKKIQKIIFLLTSLICLFIPTSIKISAWKNPITLNPYQQETEEFRAVWVATVYNLDMDV